MRRSPSLRLIEVGFFGSRIEAELAKALLEDAGIPAFVRADDAGGMRPSLQFTAGVAVIVRAEDQPQARAVLKAAHA